MAPGIRFGSPAIGPVVLAERELITCTSAPVVQPAHAFALIRLCAFSKSQKLLFDSFRHRHGFPLSLSNSIFTTIGQRMMLI
jgi:hypothetical protein